MGAAVSSSHIVSAAPSSSTGGLLSLCPCSSMGPSHEVQSFRNRLLQGASPMGSQVLPEHLLQHGLLSPRRHRFCQEPAPLWAIHGVTASFGHPPAPVWSPPWAAGGDLLHCGPPWAAEDSLPHCGLLHELQGNLCSSTWSTFSPSFFTDLRAASHFFHIFSLLSPGAVAAAQIFFPLLNYVMLEMLPPPLMGSDLASGRSILEPSSTGFIRHGGSFWQLLTPIPSPLPKPCHANPIQFVMLLRAKTNLLLL